MPPTKLNFVGKNKKAFIQQGDMQCGEYKKAFQNLNLLTKQKDYSIAQC